MSARETPTRVARQIAAHLKRLGIECPGGFLQIDRTHAGHWQRSEGAWSWSIGINADIGGFCPAKELGRCKDVAAQTNRFGFTSLDPCATSKNALEDYCDPCFDLARRKP